MANKYTKLALSITEKRKLSLQNELKGSLEYCDGLERHLEKHPEDTWAIGQLKSYRLRAERVRKQLEDYD